jgi:hypothetical protein
MTPVARHSGLSCRLQENNGRFIILRKISVRGVLFYGTLLTFRRNFASVVRTEELRVENENAFFRKVLPCPPMYTASHSITPNLNLYQVVNPECHRECFRKSCRKMYQRESVFRHTLWPHVIFQISRNVLLFPARIHIYIYLLQFSPKTYLSLWKNSCAIL